MPQVSKIKLDKKTEEKLVTTFKLILTKINRYPKMDSFITTLLTPTERLMLAKRIAIIILLRENLSDSQIAVALHVTRVTVSRMRFFVEARGEGYEVVFQVLENEKLMKELKSLLSKLAKYTINAAGGRINL